MDPLPHPHTPNINTQPGLRKSKSGSTLRSKPRRITGFIKRFFTECNSVLVKLKSLSDIALSEDIGEGDSLFESEDSDFVTRKQIGGGLKQREHQFLCDFNNYKSLEGISNHYQQLESKSTMGSSEELGKIPFLELDISKLREKLESTEKAVLFTSDMSTDVSDESKGKSQNMGEVLWDYRRSLWLDARDEKAESETSHDSLKDIPKNLYPKIYSNLIEKSKPLKEGKRINLQDLLDVINEGWIQEQRWERAAKGLA